ncbi:MetQ/NlpA family ABC transporter substrate-binding protein [Ureibacillus terrenus]|uniref:MetQ/NlpA family ABC transporter substrate-binding protein n=1 Tax=Ureibacillus terrenus TaxID=118246 RepID=UPI002E242ECA|nr:MetQ/NlpA family ABC transporter substrate-binding protein [Ureibacillus terrenus]
MKRIYYYLFLILTVAILAACEENTEKVQANKQDDKTISLIVFDNPAYVEATEIAKEEAKKLGYTLDVTYINDIIQPNEAVNAKEAFGNWFQHKAYLNQFNLDHHTNLVPTFDIYIDVAGLYSTKHDSIDDIKENAVIAIPIDPSNNGRALFMLEDLGLIKLKKGKKVTETSLLDIEENPLNLQFREVDQLMLSRVIDDVDLAFAFASTLSTGNLDHAKPIIIEDNIEEISDYMETIAVHKDNADDSKIKILRQAFQNDRVKETFHKNFPKVILGW